MRADARTAAGAARAPPRPCPRPAARPRRRSSPRAPTIATSLPRTQAAQHHGPAGAAAEHDQVTPGEARARGLFGADVVRLRRAPQRAWSRRMTSPSTSAVPPPGWSPRLVMRSRIVASGWPVHRGIGALDDLAAACPSARTSRPRPARRNLRALVRPRWDVLEGGDALVSRHHQRVQLLRLDEGGDHAGASAMIWNRPAMKSCTAGPLPR